MNFIKTFIDGLTSKYYKFDPIEHQTILNASRKLSKFVTINCGGCAISALALYRYMDKKHIVNKSTSFKFLYGSKCIRNDSVLAAPSHVVLFHNGRCYDSNGEYMLNNSRNIVTVKNENDVLRSINGQKSGWNNTFDRKKYCGSIAHTLGVSLKDVIR